MDYPGLSGKNLELLYFSSGQQAQNGMRGLVDERTQEIQQAHQLVIQKLPVNPIAGISE